jgi:hypothetical protein
MTLGPGAVTQQRSRKEFMVDYTQLAPNLNDVADLLDPPGPRDESKAHVSDLIHAILEVSANRKPVLKRSVVPNGMMAMGRIWETSVRGYMDRAAAEEGMTSLSSLTLTVDDTIGNLDQLFWGQDRRVVGETKLKFSRHTDPRENKRYMYQVKAYCYMAKALEVWMSVAAITAQPPDVDFRIFRLEFSQSEVDSNWEMLMNMKEHLEGNS